MIATTIISSIRVKPFWMLRFMVITPEVEEGEVGNVRRGDCTPYFARRVPARFSGLLAASAVICHAFRPEAATFCHSRALSGDVFCHLGHKVRPPLPPRLVARPHDGGATAAPWPAASSQALPAEVVCHDVAGAVHHAHDLDAIALGHVEDHGYYDLC